MKKGSKDAKVVKETTKAKKSDEVEEVKNQKKDARPIWIYFLILIVTGFLSGFISALMGKDVNKLIELSTLSVPVIVFFIFLMLYKDRLIEDYKKLTKSDYKMILIHAVIIIVVNIILSNLIRVDNPNQSSVVNILGNYKLTGTLVIVFITPIVEEMIYRYSLRTLIKDRTLYMAISSFIFGLCHGISYQIVIYVFIGLMLSFVYLRSKENVIAPTIAHILNNLISVLMVFLGL